MMKWLRSWFGGGRIPENPKAWEAFWMADGDVFGPLSQVLITSPNEALEIAAVWCGVELIASDVASLPLVVTDDTKNPENAQKDEDIYFMLRHQPRRGLNAHRFWQRMMVQVMLWNNGYARVFRDNMGRPTSLYEIPSEYVYWNPQRDIYEVSNSIWGYVELRPSQMLHIEGLSWGGDRQDRIDRWRKASASWGLSKATQDFTSNFFARGATEVGVYEVPESLPLEAKQAFEAHIEEKYGGVRNAGKTITLHDGVKWHSRQVKPSDAELSELRENQVREVARWLKIPPHKLGLQEATSYSSLVEETKAYYRHTLGPWLKNIQDECWSKLLRTVDQRSERLWIVHDLAPVFENDPSLEDNGDSGQQPRPATTTQESVEPMEDVNGNGRSHNRLVGVN